MHESQVDRERINEVSRIIVDAAYQIHARLGPGLTEKVYETVLARDLVRRGLSVERQKYGSFEYDGLWFENALRADLVLDGCVVVEVKSRRQVADADLKQLLTYLRLLDYRLGLLLNFGGALMKDGIRRVANGM